MYVENEYIVKKLVLFFREFEICLLNLQIYLIENNTKISKNKTVYLSTFFHIE
jgi:hypothetical protein